ncbi:capsule biosynthesis protein [Phenylobacterium montanum]|uniref:Capsule biosynthesis protein n=1 Tax=Phenylobacterium montanum TaxID=2823693 RepID=A0A975G1D1_9CAUL|nr:capsule biosynthesis protein [Caulobacter sp. S6]QUD89095.1 capsule biosynthesis protein [Caulobacter sp. S6]
MDTQVYDRLDIAERRAARKTWMVRGKAIFARHWGLLGFVVLPTLVASIYLFAFASNQYVSEAHFIVRNSQQTMTPPTGIGQLFGLGAAAQSQTDSFSVADYLQSNDAVSALNAKLNIVNMFGRPDVDFLSRLTPHDPAPETLLRYYRRQVRIVPNEDTGEIVMTVRAFQPADARSIAETLLQLGESRVNDFNARADQEALRVTDREVAEAQVQLANIQAQLTQFRSSRGDIDPVKTSGAQLLLVSRLQEELADAESRQASMMRFISPSSPQAIAAASRIRALKAQISAESARLSSNGGGMAPKLAGYEGLLLQQDLAAKRYAVASAAAATAREEARKQRLFIVRVVEPNLPVKSLYPRRLVTIGTLLAGLLVAYGIGWLLLAGVREHAD